MAQEDIYNVQPNDNGVLYDLRYNQDFQTKLNLYNFGNTPVNLFTLNPTLPKDGFLEGYTYNYGYKASKKVEDLDVENDKLYEIVSGSVNKRILMDKDGNPLFCKELLLEYGIAFILSDWLVLDETTKKLYVKFKPSYLWAWYHDENDNICATGLDSTKIQNDEEIKSDEIYSTAKLNPTDQVPLYNIDTYEIYANTNEKYVKSFFKNTFTNSGSLKTFDYEAKQKPDYTYGWYSKETYFKVLYSRIFTGTHLLSFSNEPSTVQASAPSGFEKVYPTITNEENPLYTADKLPTTAPPDHPPIPEQINFLTYVAYLPNCDTWNNVNQPTNTGNNRRKVSNLFVRIKAPIDDFHQHWGGYMGVPYEAKPNKGLTSILNELTDNDKYNLLACWIEEGESLKLYYAGTASDCNIYNKTNIANPSNFSDNTFLVAAQFTDGQFIIKLPVVVRLAGIEKDVDKLTDRKWKDIFNSSTTTVPLDYSKNSGQGGVSISDSLNKFFTEEILSCKTPMEYYAEVCASTSDTAFEDAMGSTENTTKNTTTYTWFWLDTFKNWCMYTTSDNGIIYLTCWDGFGGWDRVENLVWDEESNEYELAVKYHYTKGFFKHHVTFPGSGIFGDNCLSIRFIDGSIGRLYYDTTILTHETKLQNYNNHFQNKHSGKFYTAGERNEISNVGLGIDEDTETSDGHHVHVDETRPAAFTMDTQFCPTLIKLLNGDVAIIHTFMVEGNEVEIDKARNIINSDLANQRCKEIFGAGNDKTIEKDWKRYFNNDTTEEIVTKITFNPDDLIYGAPGLTTVNGSNKINSIKLFANRLNPTTNNQPDEDYLEKWN